MNSKSRGRPHDNAGRHGTRGTRSVELGCTNMTPRWYPRPGVTLIDNAGERRCYIIPSERMAGAGGPDHWLAPRPSPRLNKNQAWRSFQNLLLSMAMMRSRACCNWRWTSANSLLGVAASPIGNDVLWVKNIGSWDSNR